MTARGVETGGADEFFILSLKWTRSGEAITWWREDNAGYTTDLQQAGRYPAAKVLERRSYYDNKVDTLAIPCEAAFSIARTRISVDRGGIKFLRADRKAAFRKMKASPPRDGAREAGS